MFNSGSFVEKLEGGRETTNKSKQKIHFYFFLFGGFLDPMEEDREWNHFHICIYVV